MKGLWKQLLTQGERYVMTIFALLSLEDQGVYDVINNLGSMAARYLFLPIEESAYSSFAQLLTRSSEPIETQPRTQVEPAVRHLRLHLRGLTLLGAIILVFGWSYSHLLLHFYGGRTLTDGSGPLLMKTHWFAVSLMAVNGVTEAYVTATMSREQLNKYNRLLFLPSAVYLGLLGLLNHLLGSVGFILANCINMALRIGFRYRSLNAIDYLYSIWIPYLYPLV